MSSRTRRAALAACLVLLATILPMGVSAGPAGPPVSPALCDARPNDTFKKLLECVTLDGVREHQAALQEIADGNGGTRVSTASRSKPGEATRPASWSVAQHSADSDVLFGVRRS